MTDTTTGALQTIIDSGVLGSVSVLCILGLIWGIKKVLSDKDKAIERKNAVIDKKDAKIDELLGVTNSFANTLSKLVDTVERNHSRNEATLDKILDSMGNCKDLFNSLSSNIKGQNT